MPPGIFFENVTAAGVRAQSIWAPGAMKSHVILYLHGGGWVIGLTDSARIYAAALSQATGACVLLPDYRLAPEHPFPASLDDCVATYHWLLHQGVAASHIVIIGGSAGGNLALAMVLALRDHNDPLPAALVLISPITDLTMSGETYQTKASVDPSTVDFLRNAFAAYTGNGATNVRNPLVSPIYADVHGLPPTLIQVGTQEMLLSDSTRMAARLREALVEVTLEVWPGMWHVFPTSITFPFVGDIFPEGWMALQHITKHVHRHLGP